MKFGKQLKETVSESLPEWQPNFIDYKELKRRINGNAQTVVSGDVDCSVDMVNALEVSSSSRATMSVAVSASSNVGEVEVGRGATTRAVTMDDSSANPDEFLNALKFEVEKVNNFYLDMEEDFIIRFQFLASKVDKLKMKAAPDRQQVRTLRKKLIDFQSELVLLENFSAVNYTGFRKILKKHDKKTGLDLRSTYLLAVLETPFFLSNSLKKLMSAAEKQLYTLDMFTKFRRTAMSSFGTLNSEPTLLYDFQPILKLLENGDDASGTRLLNLLDATSTEKLLINWEATKELRTLTFLILDSTDDHFVGVCVVPPGEKAQYYIKKQDQLYTRLLQGQCTLKHLKGRGGEMSKCVATGPWPAFHFETGDCIEWRNESSRNALLLVVTIPGFDGEMDQLSFSSSNRNASVLSEKRVVTTFPAI